MNWKDIIYIVNTRSSSCTHFRLGAHSALNSAMQSVGYIKNPAWTSWFRHAEFCSLRGSLPFKHSACLLSRPETLQQQRGLRRKYNPRSAAAGCSGGTATGEDCVYWGNYRSQPPLFARPLSTRGEARKCNAIKWTNHIHCSPCHCNVQLPFWGCTSDYDIGHAPTQRLCCRYDSTINHIQFCFEKECEQLETLAAVELYQSVGLCSAAFSHLPPSCLQSYCGAWTECVQGQTG